MNAYCDYHYYYNHYFGGIGANCSVIKDGKHFAEISYCEEEKHYLLTIKLIKDAKTAVEKLDGLKTSSIDKAVEKIESFFKSDR